MMLSRISFQFGLTMHKHSKSNIRDPLPRWRRIGLNRQHQAIIAHRSCFHHLQPGADR